MNRIPILLLIETGGPGGAESVFRALASGLRSDRWLPIAAIPYEGWLSSAVSSDGCKPKILNARDHGRLRNLISIVDLVRRHRVRLIHAHLLGAGTYAAIAGLLAAVPVICTLHGLPDLGGSPLRTRVKLKVSSAGRNRLVFVSNTLASRVAGGYGIGDESFTVIHNGVEERTAHPRGTERRELGAGPEDFLIGALGNIRPAKDYSTLLRAFARVRAADESVKLAIVGDTENATFPDLIALRDQLSLNQSVVFAGFREDVPELLSAMDLVVSSSHTEGFSLSTVEAMLMGKPVVATRSGGPEEIVTNEVTGLLVPTGDPAALASAILRVRGSPTLATSLGERARNDVRARFSRQRMIHGYEELYESLVRPHPPRV